MTNLKSLPTGHDQQQIEQIALIVDAVLNSKSREYVEQLKRKVGLLEENLKKSDEVTTAQAENMKIMREIIDIKEKKIKTLLEAPAIQPMTILNRQSSDLVTLGRMTLFNIVLSIGCVASLVAIYIHLS